jgi:predicted HicB family RNase H-like nuclease
METQNGKAATRAKNKYNAQKYDSLRIVVPKGRKAGLQAHAERQGESLNGFVNRAIDETVQRDNTTETDAVPPPEDTKGGV